MRTIQIPASLTATEVLAIWFFCCNEKIQVTKTGYVYAFDLESGQPLFDIQEKLVPASDVPGESAWTTQPIPVSPPPISEQSIDAILRSVSNVTLLTDRSITLAPAPTGANFRFNHKGYIQF